jgi:4-hydroxy-2-oxoheptanedioate aldolase
MENKILAKARAGQKAHGCRLVFPCAELIELLGIAGFDYVNLEAEQGLFSLESIDAMCRAADAAGLTVVAHLATIDEPTIVQFLNRGVLGIIGSHIDTAEQARKMVDACRFPPAGKRGWEIGGRYNFYNDTQAIEEAVGDRTRFRAKVNEELVLVGILESISAIENIDAILAVEGVDFLYFGASDLAQSMGFPGQPDHPAVVEAMDRTTERIHASGHDTFDDVTARIDAPTLILDAARGFLARV